MTKTENCIFCNTQKRRTVGRGSLWCSAICRDAQRAIEKAMPRLCKVCGGEHHQKSRYCSIKCRDTKDAQQARQKRLQSLKDLGMVVVGETNVCALKTCGMEFVVPYSGQKYCSSVCRERFHGRDKISTGEVIASRVYFGQCKYCKAWKSTRAKWCINRLSCLDCQKRRMKENDTRKNHRRRAAGELIMTVESLAKRDGIKCNICTKPVNMSKSGLDPLGPTIDHLLPVSKGGTNDSFNLALAHRQCNTSRGNRGHAQLLLEIDHAWATTKTA
jgi:hypothetical protein